MENTNVLMGAFPTQTAKDLESITRTTSSDVSELNVSEENLDIPEPNPDEPPAGLSTPAMIAIGVVAFLIIKKFMR